MQNKDYYAKPFSVEMQNYVSKYGEEKNHEKLANALINIVTESIGRYFKISKKKGVFSGRGRCWLSDCMDIQEELHDNARKKQCDIACRFCCKGNTTKEKLLDLDKKSISSISSLSISKI